MSKHFRGPFVPKKEIAYWYPVSHAMARAVDEIRNRRATDGRPKPPFQTIDEAIIYTYEHINTVDE